MKSFNKKLIIFNIILFVIFLAAVFKIYETYRKNNLNVILISVDTIRADHTGVYGYAKNTTPNLDKLAKSSTVYTNLRTVVPMTWPSFIALFTGLTPYSTRISTNGFTIINPSVKTLPDILSKNGYKTAAYASNIPNIRKEFGEFNYFLNKEFYYDNGVERYKLNDQFGSDEIVKGAKNWLDKNQNNKFFLWVHLMDPHAPYYPSDEYKCVTNKKYCGNVLNKSLDELDLKHATFQLCQNSKVPSDVVGEMETLYDGGIKEADYYIGDLLSKIRDLGLDKNTLIVFYSDHGEGFDHNYYFNHRGVLYDSAVKIPLIIRNPIFPIGSKSQNLLANTDIMPTILDMLGISAANLNIDGSVNGEGRKYVYSVNNNWTKYSIYDGEFKYIYSLPNSCLLNNQKEELYDVKNDKNELNNIASKSSKKKQELKDQLFLYLSKYNLPTSPNQMPMEETNQPQNKKNEVKKPAADSGKLDEAQIKEMKSLSY